MISIFSADRNTIVILFIFENNTHLLRISGYRGYVLKTFQNIPPIMAYFIDQDGVNQPPVISLFLGIKVRNKLQLRKLLVRDRF